MNNKDGYYTVLLILTSFIVNYESLALQFVSMLV